MIRFTGGSYGNPPMRNFTIRRSEEENKKPKF